MQHKLYMKKIAIDRYNLEEIETLKKQYTDAGWEDAGTVTISGHHNFIRFTWDPDKGNPRFPQVVDVCLAELDQDPRPHWRTL